MIDPFQAPESLLLGANAAARIPIADQQRQRAEVDEVLRRFSSQPGVVVADEVGMGKTFVALGVAFSVAMRAKSGPVVVMAPANLIDKWVQDLHTFCELYVDGITPELNSSADGASRLRTTDRLRYGIARHSIEFMKLLDDPPRERCQIIFLAQGAMSRQQTDKWIRLYLIAETLRKHGRRKRLALVKPRIHNFLARLLWAIGEQRKAGDGNRLWATLLKSPADRWRAIVNASRPSEPNWMTDDPIPVSLVRAMDRLNLVPMAEALEKLPVRAAGTQELTDARVDSAREEIVKALNDIWVEALRQMKWRSPLLVLDEAHHVKNPGTMLAKQFQSLDADVPRTGDGAMANAFERMLFLTATPFQLAHTELVRVLERFCDVRWDRAAFGEHSVVKDSLHQLGQRLDVCQRTVMAFHRAWSRLDPGDVAQWIDGPDGAEISHRAAAARDRLAEAEAGRVAAENALRPWIVRHNKDDVWAGSSIPRRRRLEGGARVEGAPNGIPVPSRQLLPFYLAARSAINPHKDLLGEALCSSFEAFRDTRKRNRAQRDELDEVQDTEMDRRSHSKWYLEEFDRAMTDQAGADHPKLSDTVRRTVDLWEGGEKVLVFAFYRETCRALRFYISQELERRMTDVGIRRAGVAVGDTSQTELAKAIDSVQNRFFDTLDSPGRRAIDAALQGIIEGEGGPGVTQSDWGGQLQEVMRRFLRVPTTVMRCFPFERDRDPDAAPDTVVSEFLEHCDESGLSWGTKLRRFTRLLSRECSEAERGAYLAATNRIQTGGIRVASTDEHYDSEGDRGTVLLANVQIASGGTDRDQRARLMRAFNTPFFPDILVCSQVMGEGVDLQRNCRYVIHHDLDWNPSTIEQRTGRIDRIGCKAEGKHSIVVDLPYLAGMGDERQFRVMSERETWFKVVMGQDKVAQMITDEKAPAVPLPPAITKRLSFRLGLAPEAAGA